MLNNKETPLCCCTFKITVCNILIITQFLYLDLSSYFVHPQMEMAGFSDDVEYSLYKTREHFCHNFFMICVIVKIRLDIHLCKIHAWVYVKSQLLDVIMYVLCQLDRAVQAQQCILDQCEGSRKPFPEDKDQTFLQTL